jgi:hypothetical protein
LEKRSTPNDGFGSENKSSDSWEFLTNNDLSRILNSTRLRSGSAPPRIHSTDCFTNEDTAGPLVMGFSNHQVQLVDITSQIITSCGTVSSCKSDEENKSTPTFIFPC